MVTPVFSEHEVNPAEFNPAGLVPGPRFFSAAAERLLGLHRIGSIYSGLSKRKSTRAFLDDALDALDISCSVSDHELERIPKQGPVVVISNHPFGAIDGLLLSFVLLRIRPDVKVMANYLLSKVPELQPLFISVDPFGTKNAVKKNVKPMRETIQFLRDGGLVSIFPAGEVSHVHLKQRTITDPEWSMYVGRLVKKTESTVVPVFFEGNNSLIFHLLGLFYPMLRTLMLPREMLRKTHREIVMKIGQPIPPKRLVKISQNEELIRYLRFRTYVLGRQDRKDRPTLHLLSSNKKNRMSTPVISPESPGRMAEELDLLPREQKLIEHGRFSVFHAKSHQIPRIIREIGRLREITFRAEQEGTGRDSDIDRFDMHYTHLVLWDHREQQVIGSYRLGLTDQIFFRYGIRGLYTNSLFDYGVRFLEQIGPAIELGRSFVRREYQKTYQSLMLLWRGIARYVYLNPQYKVLFGPVSISKRYQPVSRHLMASFLRERYQTRELRTLVKPRNPLRGRKTIRPSEVKACVGLFQDLGELSEVISEIEGDRKGVPILLKQYLKLGGLVLGLNVDPHFNDVLDALILVDLTASDRSFVERFLGKEETAFFCRYHQARLMVNDG